MAEKIDPGEEGEAKRKEIVGHRSRAHSGDVLAEAPGDRLVIDERVIAIDSGHPGGVIRRVKKRRRASRH